MREERGERGKRIYALSVSCLSGPVQELSNQVDKPIWTQ